MRKKVIKIFAMWLTVFVCIFAAGLDNTSYYSISKAKTGDEIRSEINDVMEEEESLQEKRKALKKKIRKLRKNIENVESYIEGYDKELEDIDKKIDDNRQKLKECKLELKGLEDELNRTKLNKDKQYTTMVKRIQYMYENEGNGYADIIFSSLSLSDILNNMEYVERISSYDDNMFKVYTQVCKEIEEDSADVQKKEEEYEAIREELKFEKQSIKKLLKEKTDQVEKYRQNIKDGKEDAKDYDAQIVEAEEKLDKLLEEERIKIAEEEANNSSNNSNSTTTNVSPGKAGFAWPLPMAARISSGFGPRKQPTKGASTYHKGIDISVPAGTSVLASKDGKVVTAMYSTTAGNFISIYHGNGQYTYYMHCSRLLVSVGNKVKRGQLIAKSGNTGVSTGAHLHFGLFMNGNYVNPSLYVHP